MRLRYLAALIAFPMAAFAQGRPLTTADSNLVGRILLAEDRRDSTAAALVEGARHSDLRVRTLALRARGRIVDPKYAARDSLPPLAAPPHWDEPAWRLRLLALTPKSECGALRLALSDSAWPVRLRATDLLVPACAADEVIVSTLREWIDALPADASRRRAGEVSWHAAAHAGVALARLRPAEAQQRMSKLASHRQPQVRAYAARAAAVLGDSLRLRTLARDPDDNVKAAAIEGLNKITGHTDDPTYLAAVNGRGAQAVRAAAVALKGSPRSEARTAAASAYARWAAEGNASAHDVRAALLEAAGRPATDDRAPPVHAELLPQEVALALGADIRLRVTMAPTSGGGSFVVRLRGDNAPLMAARILALSRARYYDGLTWHRVEHDFVIQGGSPAANEYVGLPEFMRDELGTIPHVRGTVGMSTRGHDTGDAQWFVNLRDNLRLGRDYTVFAEVVDGIDVVDGILEGDVIARIEEVPPRR
jgi:cyclophilin family peptidyl-prolyl cis-trans isomerase